MHQDTLATEVEQRGIRHVLTNTAVIVAALGYFVDIYDLVLFSIVRVKSLEALGYFGAANTDHGLMLINMQMIGMLIGGILWGVLGDKRGRLSVLFGSIFLYSLANVMNGMVETVDGYAVWRLIAGIGLAGELGAGITLVAEVLPKETRGYGTMVVATIGITGAILAGIIGESYDWRVSYFIGGGLGFLLLFLRMGVLESLMFDKLKSSTVSRGNFFRLFSDRQRFFRYLRCILIGMPTWYIVGILVTFSPEFAKAFGVTGAVTPAYGILFCYAGLAAGDFASGTLSQRLRSRKKVMYIFISLTAVFVTLFFTLRGLSPQEFYAVCAMLGFGVGYWAIFVTVAAEQFGTNMRATVATTVPNFVRGALVPMVLVFSWLKGHYGIATAGAAIGAVSILLTLNAVRKMEETFGKDLDYIEST